MLAAVVPNYKTVLGFTDDFEATMIKKINSGQTTDASETAVREAQQWTQTVRNTLETTIVHHRGQNILLKSLPAKFETVLRCPLSSHTRAKCDAIVEKQFFKRINQQRQWVLPEKMVYALHLINQFRVRGHRCLLFTQFIDTVDALQQACPYASVITGKTSGRDRQSICSAFQSCDGFAMLIISTKCGSLGLNLTNSTHVLMMEPSWNPSHDIQACMRSWRMGQTDQVYIYRLVSDSTRGIHTEATAIQVASM